MQLVERHSVVGIDIEQLGRDRRQSQTLLYDGHGHEKGGGDLLLGLAFVAQRQEGAELVERVQRRALDILGEAILLGDAAFAKAAKGLAPSWPGASASPGVPAPDSGGRQPGSRTCRFRCPRRRKPAAPAVMLCSKVRRAMSSASSSIETPALIRRTLDWLSRSLLNGMSREELRTIF